MQQQLLNRTIIFWNNIFTFSLWWKRWNDFLIKRNNNQFTDTELFELINENISNINTFIQYFNNNNYCIFGNYITVNERNINNIVNYINNLYETDDIKSIIFMIFLRCEIDNINYPPSLNWCKRIFMQVILILSKKFNLWIRIKNIDIEQYTPEFVYEIWHPWNNYKVSKSDFEKLYIDFKNNYLPIIWN